MDGPPIARSLLQADLHELQSILEDSHPDPYGNAGGVIAFRRRFADALEHLPPQGMTARAFSRLVRPLAAQIGDGHTFVARPDGSDNARVWIDLGVIDRRVVVTGIYSSTDRQWLGATVTSVDGSPIGDVAERLASLQGHDNEYENLENLARVLASRGRLEDVLERSLGPRVRFGVSMGDHAPADLEASVADAAPGSLVTIPSRVALPPTDAADLAAGFLDASHHVAVLRVGSSMRYREAFEVWQSVGFTAMLGDHLDGVVHAATGRTPDGNISQRIAQLPAVTDRLQKLVTEMKADRTETLVFDLRDNTGGSGAFASIVAYFLYPLDRILAVNAASGYQVPRYSALYFKTHEADSLDKVRDRTRPWLQLGDLDFSDERAWRDAQKDPRSPNTLAGARKDFDDLVGWSPTFRTAVASGKWNAAWTPKKVIVLVSASTLSAGFDAVLQLRALGAEVVGVPPGQAANCFIDAMPFELSQSHLSGQVSYKYSVQLPNDAANGRTLGPDRELTYERYAALGYDPNATVLLALSPPSSPTKR